MKQLIKLIRELAYKEGDFTLASGQKSTYFIDFTKVAMTYAGQREIYNNIILRIGRNLTKCYIGGPATGAIPIIQTLVARKSRIQKYGFYVKKPYSIEGVLPPKNSQVVMIDDVVTSGNSLLEAAKLVQEFTQANIVNLVAVVDREQGAAENCRKAGFDLISIVKLSEIKSA